MKHFKVDWRTDLKNGDYVLYGGRWQEIWSISMDNGILLSWSGYVCRSKIEEDSVDPVLIFEI